MLDDDELLLLFLEQLLSVLLTLIIKSVSLLCERWACFMKLLPSFQEEYVGLMLDLNSKALFASISLNMVLVSSRLKFEAKLVVSRYLPLAL